MNQGSVYGSEGLLSPPGLASSSSDLLPTNTQIFPSTLRYGAAFHIVLGSALILCVIFFGCAGALSGGSGQSACAALGSLILIGSVVALVIMARRANAKYTAMLSRGEWHEGIIVFPSGDVVLRFRGVLPMMNVNRTIESVYLSRAEVEKRFSLTRCGYRDALVIYYLGIDGRNISSIIASSDLRDAPELIVNHINSLKSKTMHGF